MYRIVIADDEKAIRDGLASFVAWDKLGFEVAAALEDGRAVIDWIASTPIDVALCDIRMPRVTGLDVAKYVFENNLETTVVLLSAYRDFEYARSAMTCGVRHYIVKSTRYQDLLATFETIRGELDARLISSHEDPLIQAAKAYIRTHLDTASLEKVAAHLGRNPAYLSRLFKERSDQGFLEYLTAKRMAYATRLLSDMSVKTYSVAERVGYANPKNFTRTFIRCYGVSPREYRNRQARGAEEKKP